MEEIENPLKTWSLYFQNEEYTIFNQEINLIIDVRKKLTLSNTELKEIAESLVFECDYSFFKSFNCPASSIKCFSCAVSEKIFERFNKVVLIETKIINHDEVTSFADIGTDRVDKLVTIMGTCCRAGFKKIENIESYFECTTCSNKIKVINTGNIYRVPKCPCKGKNIIFLSNHPDTKCRDKQEIKVQEIYGSEGNSKVLEIDVFGSTVGTVVPGDLIKITGIVKAELSGDAYKLKIECNNLSIIKNRNFLKDSSSFDSYEIFKKISEEPNLISIFINNLYPNVFGNSFIKAGLILSLFGGSKKYVGVSLVRSEIHVLIIGDPGLGKSKLLLNTVGILPKSTYVSGNFCTTAGLTVSITHDPVTGEYMADAGALVVSDGGICCIDEFDKIDDHTALYEAMEDQRVTVAKGGVCCSVPTRSTIIAASNPRYGHFDSKKTIKENLKFDFSLLSRFDLVFILIDNLSEKENYEIGNQILKKRHYSSDLNLSSMIDKLRKDDFIENSDVKYPKEILMKYIEYARMSINPVLSKAAKQTIREYYMELRKDRNVSIRNLESLVRLTESYAKMELKPVASATHAQFAVQLYKKMFIKDRVETKTSKVSVESCLQDYIEKEQINIITKEELVRLIKGSGTKKSEYETIEMLNFKGILIKKADGTYKINLEKKLNF